MSDYKTGFLSVYEAASWMETLSKAKSDLAVCIVMELLICSIVRNFNKDLTNTNYDFCFLYLRLLHWIIFALVFRRILRLFFVYVMFRFNLMVYSCVRKFCHVIIYFFLHSEFYFLRRLDGCDIFFRRRPMY